MSETASMAGTGRAGAYNPLTQSPHILRALLTFALPIVGGNILTQFYNLADSVVVGQFVGSDALAAVGSCFAIQMIAASLFTGLGSGAGVLVAQFCGARNRRDMSITVCTAYILAFILGAVLTIVGMLASRPLLQLINTPENILDDATAYLSIIFIGSIGHIFYQMGTALLRCMGDTRGPFLILLFCTTLNVGLDLLFVLVFGMGVPGVAWATILAQALSALLVILLTLRGGHGLIFNRETLRLNGARARQIFAIGVPIAAQMILMSSGMLVVQSLINSFGSAVVAANTAVQKVDGFLIQPMLAVGSAVTTFVGQNLGAGQLRRSQRGTHLGGATIAVFCLAMALPVFFFGGSMVRLFANNQTVISIAGQALKTLAFFYVFMGLTNIYTGAIKGAGTMMAPTVITVVNILVRVPFALFFISRGESYMGIYYAMNISNIVAASLTILYYFFGGWRKKAAAVEQRASPDAMTNPV
ncbi:MATE family efflux transporter [Ruminococcaceae bacterium OttesenSCG-928-D13]|nr:MATE family efflux transporter [Ruminococcaceae bacterium OttesenSCG-928-D13]